MTNHPNRGKLSREALELIATFAAGGIALTRPQQYAVATICRAARTIRRVAEAECSGPPKYRRFGDAEWEAWEKSQATAKARAEARIAPAVRELPQVVGFRTGGDPRGATVKLVMSQPYNRMHDDWGRDGVCVPGS